MTVYNVQWRAIILLFAGYYLLELGNIAYADPVLWKVQSGENTVYLFGSIHVADNSVYPLRPAIESAFNNSKVLVVEVDETQADQVKLNEILMTRGFYPGTETIADHINKDTMQMLRRFLEQSGMPYATVARMRPGLIAITLTVARIVQLGYSPELGIDRYFINKARKNSKPILQLESAEWQMELMLSFSDDDLILKHTLISLDEMDDMFKQIMDAWKSGDKRLFDERNITMTEKIIAMFKQQKNYFVVVGAGHLVGEQGIVSLLKKQGFQVESVQ